LIDNQVLGNTIVSHNRLESLCHKLQSVHDKTGSLCEIGVYKGGTARLICRSNSGPVTLIDTFEGLPQACDKDNYHKKGDFNDTSVEHVKRVLQDCSNYTIIKSRFPECVSELGSQQFKFVHIDVDLYQSVKDCLEWFYPRMVSGGWLILDDYGAGSCLGAKIATEEFLAGKPLTLMVGPDCQASILCP
jgi:O-methyltransferase